MKNGTSSRDIAVQTGKGKMKYCPNCHSSEIKLYVGGQFGEYECKSCGYIGSFILDVDNIKPIRILIIGAGFAGLQTAVSLKKILKDKVSITLIDKNQFHLFVPGLDSYLTSKLKKKDITITLSKLAKNKKIRFMKGKVNKIIPRKKEVYISKRRIAYDYLVISVGSEPNDYGIKGVDKYTYKYKTLHDAESLKKKIKELASSRKKFNIALVGGGITGVQLASHLREYLDKKYKAHNIKISIMQANSRLLRELPVKVSNRVEKYLRRKNIDICFDSPIIRLEKNKLYLKSKKKINSDLIIWVAGITVPKGLERFNLDYSNKGIYVNKYLQSIDNPFVFALGDCISFKDKDLEKCAKRAQNARKQGNLAARNISNVILNKKMIPYTLNKIPTIISLNDKSIIHFKNFIMQNKFVSFLDNLIRLRHMMLR